MEMNINNRVNGQGFRSQSVRWRRIDEPEINGKRDRLRKRGNDVIGFLLRRFHLWWK